MKLITLVMIVGLYGVFILAEPLNTDSPISPNLKLVATADGKSFFAENTNMNWFDAGKFCVDLGMKLAEITSKAQLDALNAVYSSDFRFGYWIGGRDANQARQFSWNSGNEAISNDIKITNHRGIALQTCLVYDCEVNNRYLVYYIPCKENAYVLCST